MGFRAANDSACLLRLHVDQLSRGMAVRDGLPCERQLACVYACLLVRIFPTARLLASNLHALRYLVVNFEMLYC